MHSVYSCEPGMDGPAMTTGGWLAVTSGRCRARADMELLWQRVSPPPPTPLPQGEGETPNCVPLRLSFSLSASSRREHWNRRAVFARHELDLHALADLQRGEVAVDEVGHHRRTFLQRDIS